MRADRSHPFPLISILLLFSTLSYGQAWSGVLASGRAIDWGNAGLPATLPDGETAPNPWTPPTRTLCTTINPSGDTSGATDYTDITNALSSCTAGTYILLSSGTFYIASSIYMVGASVTLRGSGAQNTTIEIEGSGQLQIGAAWGGSSATLTSGSNYAKGSTSITINTSSPPSAGNIAWLTQCDTGTSGNPCSGTPVDNGSVFVCGGNSVCEYGTGSPEVPTHQYQVLYITSVTSLGSNNYSLGISPGLYMPNWAYSLTPVLNWQDQAHVAIGMGVEDMTLNVVTATGAAYSMGPAYASWTRGVRFIGNPPGRVVSVGPNTKSCLFMNNYVFGQTPSALSSGYVNVIEQGYDSDDLLLNNIIQGGTYTLGGGRDEGVVMAYNYGRDGETTLYLGEFQHEDESSFILREANQMDNSQDDDTWGTHHFNTWFRNYYSGWDPPYYNSAGNPSGIKIDAYSRFENAVGNVIGSAYITNYASSSNYAFDFGTGDSLNQPTSMRWGNYDTVTKAVRWCGDSSDPGWSTTCGSTSEVPSSLPSPNTAYSNPVPSTTTLPISFFMNGMTAHPNGGTGLSWWKVCTSWNTFPTSCAATQTQPFPPIGPDVTGGPNINGYAYDIPAEVAFMNLPIDSTYQNSYTVTGSRWSSGTETLTVSSLPNVFHLMGGFRLTGANSACNPSGGELFMTSSSTTTVSYALTSNPGVSCTGTMLFPDVRQFDERVYQNDSGGDPSPPTGLSAIVQ